MSRLEDEAAFTAKALRVRVEEIDSEINGLLAQVDKLRVQKTVASARLNALVDYLSWTALSDKAIRPGTCHVSPGEALAKPAMHWQEDH